MSDYKMSDHKKVCIRGVVHFSMRIKAKTEEEAKKKFEEINGDDVLEFMSDNAKDVDWEFEVTSVESEEERP